MIVNNVKNNVELNKIKEKRKMDNVKIKSLKMTKSVIAQIIEIDKEFYKDFDYNNTKWYYTRYTNKNDVTVLCVNNKIVGYYLFYTISENLFKDICALKYVEDYSFPQDEVNVESDYFYVPSVLVKKEYKKYSLLLLLSLKKNVLDKKKLVAIAVSKNGKKMCKKYMKKMGNVNKNVSVYAKI